MPDRLFKFFLARCDLAMGRERSSGFSTSTSCNRIEFDDGLVDRVAAGKVPTDWRAEPPGPSTQAIGDRWVREARTAVLAVPSVLVRSETNYLLSPLHPDFSRIRIGKAEPFVFDPRLLTE